jgi:hypothetical protein
VIQPIRSCFVTMVGQPLSCLLLCLSVGIAGCGGASVPAPRTIDPAELPPYDAEAAELFDDSLALEIFQLKVDPTSIENNAVFGKRARLANRIQAVRLRTIAEDRAGDNVRYKLVVSPVAAPIVGETFAAEDELRVGQASPSLNLIRSMDVELVGRSFVVLVRSFRLGDKQVDHFRAEPDTPEMRKVLADLRSTEELTADPSNPKGE